ncbi:NAC domain-containing protein 101 [Manihot esculenta]|uniref:NAC domain-containing protein 101 n=1 Tax=Manihot esculenta TaxID=3983 RepID=UPI001CC7EBB0|nr:NAC domain-containing protein 101 [Manihot esculenta]
MCMDHKIDEILAQLPVGYKFLPTDEELVIHYLMNKLLNRLLPANIAPDIDASEFYSKPPNSLSVSFPLSMVSPSCGEREWYFFIHEHEDFLGKSRERIRMVGDGTGFWRSSGLEKYIRNSDGRVLAFKSRFFYFSGNDANAKKTHWKMDQYRLHNQCPAPDHNSKVRVCNYRYKVYTVLVITGPLSVEQVTAYNDVR